MLYFLPDSQDLVDPSFDFLTERRSRTRLRHRDDLYAHEIFQEPAYDGLLVSKGIVDGFGATGSRYTLAQRQRLLRAGSDAFFRLSRPAGFRVPVMGDCGAFTYVKEERPPYSVDDVMSFYMECGFDYGLSVDHAILEYEPAWDGAAVPAALQHRQAITLDLAGDFWRVSVSAGRPFQEVGVAQGWSPKSYASAVGVLEKIGYDYIAVGGLVPLKTPEILAILRAIDDVRARRTRLHLLGVTRMDRIRQFAALGVVSFDSTSPLRQAFKDDRDNYYTSSRTYVAIRIPQVEGNPGLQRQIASGRVPQDRARKLEESALASMRAYATNRGSLATALSALLEYEGLYDPGSNREAVYRETLAERPWERCGCDVCLSIGYHVILFRGAERNRRRGFHNVWTFYRRLQREMAVGAAVPKEAAPDATLAGVDL